MLFYQSQLFDYICLFRSEPMTVEFRQFSKKKTLWFMASPVETLLQENEVISTTHRWKKKCDEGNGDL